jgi:septum formation protein
MSGPALILASRSPRRHQLLNMLRIAHVVDPVEVDEQVVPGEDPRGFTQRLATEKARAGSARHPARWVLGADTVVVRDGAILGKPASTGEAERMLASLAGARHEVVTALALARGDTVYEACDVTAVWMRSMTPDKISAYVRTGEPMDKAGSYAIQGLGSILVERIDGDYFSVMGLPVGLVVELMDRAGMDYHFT